MDNSEFVDLTMDVASDPEPPRQEESKTPSISSQSSVDIHSVSSSHESYVEYGYLGLKYLLGDL